MTKKGKKQFTWTQCFISVLKSRNCGFCLIFLPYLVAYPFGEPQEGHVLGGDCSGGNWELEEGTGETSSLVASGQVSLQGAGSGRDTRCVRYVPW